MEIGNAIFGHSRGACPLDRGELEGVLVSGLARLGYDSYGLPLTRGYEPPEHDDLFRVRPYWWGDDDDVRATLPNLEIPSADIEIRWYKYALRDAYANREIDVDELATILDCRHEALVARGLDDDALACAYGHDRAEAEAALLDGPNDEPLY